MDGNEDEALGSAALAAESLVAGGKDLRAAKFDRTAKRLDPREGIAESCCEEDTAEKGYAEENDITIREVSSSSDYYQVLGVERGCSADDVRRAYRKLSLRVHPDKNKAPGAEDAFRLVCRAFQCLSDEDSRRRYELTGGEGDVDGSGAEERGAERRRRKTRRRRKRPATGGFYYEDIFKDEPLRPFSHDSFQLQPRAGGFELISPVKLLVMTHLLLVTLFAVLLLIQSLQRPEYSLQRTENYSVPKVTEMHGVEFFVTKNDFDELFPHKSTSRGRIENRVLKDYKVVLVRYCHAEMQRRRRVKDYPVPNCDKLRELAMA